MNQKKLFQSTGTYIAGTGLIESVNVAVALEKPLLIKGEPGTGKTVLAQAVAEALGMDLIVWNIKSTTRAQDGLYNYDTVKRLYDSQFGEDGVSDISRYIRLGKLGEAFSREDPVVLLIDEIDKADLEFPNDLLWELDRMEFYIPETGVTVQAKQRPVVIITSNAEKELPDAFLRRCIFHYIDFPDRELLAKIVRTHFPGVEEKLLSAAVSAFEEIRSIRSLRKKPGTSELLDWVNALQLGGIPAEVLEKELPFPGVLLKKDEDLDALKKHRYL